ncbi:hypothetical protein [Flavobacterium mesophilum]|uniref:hypothetical protein n=1 Tax=Flavobacterium mesophilum TaxID=3143495 RepID=UPI0031D7DA3C
MKNLKIYFGILFISLATSSIFFACSNDETQAQQSNSATKSSNLTKKTAAVTSGTITCYISGTTVSNVNTDNAFSSVTAGSTTTYQYNSTPAVSNVTWSIVPGTVNPSGSLTINGTGSTASVTTDSSFLSGSIQAVGTDETGQICGPVLPIVKSTGGGAACCTPTMSLSFVCRGSSPSGNLGGFLTLISPSNCIIDWKNTVSKIDLKLEGGPSFSGDDELYGKKSGTIYPPFTSTLNDNKINEEFYYTGCLSRVTAKATIYFNNGCPPISLNAEALKQ